MRRRPALPLLVLFPLFAAMIVASCGQDSVAGPRIAALAVFSGSGQSTFVGSTLPAPLVVIVADQNGVPVEGATINWSIVSGGGTITPATSTTGADGKASASLRVGNSTGAITVRAALGTLQPVLFLATAVAAPATKLVIASGDQQLGIVATQLPVDLAVRVTDAVDTPKQGIVVTFTVSSGGSLNTGSAITDADGLASVKWTLGTVAGVQTVIALATGIAPATFSATAAAGAPNSLAILTGNNQTGTTGAVLPDSLRVRLLDKFGNGIAGAAIVFTPGQGSGTVSPLSSLTDATGRAATKWTLGATGGQATVTAAGGGFVAQFSGGANFKYKAVSAGAKHSCGLDEGGVAYCWGYNGDGQLGIGVAAQGSGPVFAYPQPTASTGNLTFSQLIGGSYHTCALTLSGVGECWGVNVDGRLGTGSFTPVNAPTQILVTRAFASMGAGLAHSCALDLSNHAACWGRNVDAQLGFGYTAVPPQRIAPDSVAINVPVMILSGQLFSQIAAGGVHNCALELFTSAAWCWGNQVNGQLGNGVSGVAGTLPSIGTVPVIGAVAYSAITAGDLHTCAIDMSGAAWCWGNDASGQLGDNPGPLPGAIQSAPVLVSGGLTFKAISAGRSHTCAITTAGKLYCWGANDSGQLGNNSTITSAIPVAVNHTGTFQAVSAGSAHTCALSTTNIAYCWGDNQFGQLGDGTKTNRSSPVPVLFQPL